MGKMMTRKSRPKVRTSYRRGIADKVAREPADEGVSRRREKTAFDIFGSDLPDEVFAEIFEQPRVSGWRDFEFD
jgi:hypothetical protein